MGSILASTLLIFGTVLLIVLFPKTPWGWTLAAVVVRRGGMCAEGSISACSLLLWSLCFAPGWSAAVTELPIHLSGPYHLLQAALMFWPLGRKPNILGRAYISFCCKGAPQYFDLSILTEEGATFQQNKPYVVGELCYCSCRALKAFSCP